MKTWAPAGRKAEQPPYAVEIVAVRLHDGELVSLYCSCGQELDYPDGEAVPVDVAAADAAEHLASHGPSNVVASAEDLRRELGDRTRQADRLAADHRALTAQVIAGISSYEHAMTVVAGLPVCRCGLPLGGGDASGAFITHALEYCRRD